VLRVRVMAGQSSAYLNTGSLNLCNEV
jgi:hypothetical protein